MFKVTWKSASNRFAVSAQNFSLGCDIINDEETGASLVVTFVYVVVQYILVPGAELVIETRRTIAAVNRNRRLTTIAIAG